VKNADDGDPDLWAAVGEPTRRQVLDALLAHGEASASTIADELPITRQAVAKHLAVLDRAGLVAPRREGREVRYAVRPDRLVEASRAMTSAARQWEQRLQAIKQIAEDVHRAELDAVDDPDAPEALER
jgi:DNA-binding transcriptional ArsR family regulator